MVDIAANATTTATFEGSPAVMATYSGELEALYDTDWIRVTLQAGGIYQFFGSADSPGAGYGDSIITLRDPNGAEVASNDNESSGTANSYIKYSPIVSGTYFIEVKVHSGIPSAYSLVVMFDQARERLTYNADNYSGAVDAVIIGDKDDDRIDLVNAGIAALGEQGDDRIAGNTADNRLSGGLGNDSLDGLDGNDRLFGDAGMDWLHGNAGEDLLYGGPGADALQGDAGNDIIVTGEGPDVSAGGTGNDTYHVENADDYILELGGEGADTVLTMVSYTLSVYEIETLQAEVQASTAALNLTGNAKNNTLIGNNGANVLDGGGGTDFLHGLLGNDTYVLANGNDIVDDDGGVDLVTSTITRSLQAVGTDIENLTLLGTANFAGTGNNLANVITGNAGVNVLKGGLGNDTLLGLGGNDQLYGELGKDTLTGGLGDDLFRYAANGHSPVGANADVITDFDDLGNDRIDLSLVYGGTLAYRHNLAFHGHRPGPHQRHRRSRCDRRGQHGRRARSRHADQAGRHLARRDGRQRLLPMTRSRRCLAQPEQSVPRRPRKG
jgi:Ca2+-binding RTX toxin-like protein